MTRVHAADGSVLAEYSKQRRLYLPSFAIPPLVKEAFISAEDKNFYHHGGVDFEGMARAALVFVQGTRHMQGASTITQQVAKNFFLSPKRDVTRKIREALLSFRIESAYSKEKILELYLNEIYLGMGITGSPASALNYFNKSVNELTVPRSPISRRCQKARTITIPTPSANVPSTGAIGSSIGWSRTATWRRLKAPRQRPNRSV